MEDGEILMRTASASATPPTAGARFAATLRRTPLREGARPIPSMPYMAAPISAFASIAKQTHPMISREGSGRAILAHMRNSATAARDLPRRQLRPASFEGRPTFNRIRRRRKTIDTCSQSWDTVGSTLVERCHPDRPCASAWARAIHVEVDTPCVWGHELSHSDRRYRRHEESDQRPRERPSSLEQPPPVPTLTQWRFLRTDRAHAQSPVISGSATGRWLSPSETGPIDEGDVG